MMMTMRGQVSSLSDGQEEQEMFECEAIRCDMKFSSRDLRDEHQRMEHKAWEDF